MNPSYRVVPADDRPGFGHLERLGRAPGEVDEFRAKIEGGRKHVEGEVPSKTCRWSMLLPTARSMKNCRGPARHRPREEPRVPQSSIPGQGLSAFGRPGRSGSNQRHSVVIVIHPWSRGSGDRLAAGAYVGARPG